MHTQIIIDAIAILLTTGAFIVWNKWLKPWLYEHRLYEAAQVAVNAAQAIYGRYNGEKKLTNALDQLAQKGYNIDAVQVINAVRSAWQTLDTAQHTAGIKE